MLGVNGKFDVENDIHKDQRRKRIIFTVTFVVFMLVVLNAIFYFLTKV